MGVADEEFGQRVAAVVVLKNLSKTLNIEKLRNDLRATLSSYKLPTLLHVAQVLEKTASGKVPKKALRTEIFESGRYTKEIQVYWPHTSSIRAKI